MPLESGMLVSISMPHWMEAAWVSMGFMSVGDGFGLRGVEPLRTAPLPRHRGCLCRTVFGTIWRRHGKPLSIRFGHHLSMAGIRFTGRYRSGALDCRVGCVLRAQSNAGDEDVPTPRVNLLRLA